MVLGCRFVVLETGILGVALVDGPKHGVELGRFPGLGIHAVFLEVVAAGVVVAAAGPVEGVRIQVCLRVPLDASDILIVETFP